METKGKVYTYKLASDKYYNESRDEFIFHTDKDSKELIELAVTIWECRDLLGECEKLSNYNYNEDENTIEIDGETYDVPNYYEDFIDLIIRLLDNNDIKMWRPQIEVDETFYI